jgi:hypothetical protein
MRKRARTDLCGGRSVMVVPTATVGLIKNKKHWMGWSQQGREERVFGRKWSRWHLRQLQPAADIGAPCEARRKAWV